MSAIRLSSGRAQHTRCGNGGEPSAAAGWEEQRRSRRGLARTILPGAAVKTHPKEERVEQKIRPESAGGGV